MLTHRPTHRLFVASLTLVLVQVLFAPAHAQSTAALQGRVIDPTGAVLVGVRVTARNRATNEERTTLTDSDGNYQIVALPAGAYHMEIHASGFQSQIVENLVVEVRRSVVQDFQLQIGDVSEQVVVTSEGQLIERATTSVGHTIDQKTVQDIPLNGRYFLDLGLLLPGSVTPSQNGFSTTPTRGVGAFAINTAGNREETVNYMVNGITLNNLVFSSISFQPSITSVQEFKLDNSTFSAEYGQNSGAIVNVATRSGTNEFHGEVFEFFRNDALDARNFFNFNTSRPTPFKRNQFGGALGGPIIKNKTFFFFSYEGLHQLQGIDLNSVVLSDSQRASVTDPVIAKLVTLIPRANFIDSQGTPRFIGSQSASSSTDQWNADISHKFDESDKLHGYYAFHHMVIAEPDRAGTTIPGFGQATVVNRQLFTLNETHIFGPDLVSEERFGFNRIDGTNTPNAQLNPADFGIRNGIDQPIGLPQINIAGGALNFGGPSNFPAGRADTTFVGSGVVNYLRGHHSLKFGGEYRQFFTNSFSMVTGSFNFPSVNAFLTDMANSFSGTIGARTSSISEGAVGFFAQDNYKWRPGLTLELGLRYDLNLPPTERHDRFIVFDPASASLVRVGQGIDQIYHTNARNFQPRVGFAWDPFKNGKTSVRAAYAILGDQPMTSVVTATSGNPPLVTPLIFTGSLRLDNAIDLAQAAGLAPATVDQGFENAYMQSWNFNVQRELTPNFAVMIGYFGSKGTHLILRRNINQPINGVRPYPTLSPSSPIFPGTPLGNITQAEGTGNSTYNALWISANKRLSRGLLFSASYTRSKSLDYNSLSSQGVVVQNSYNLRGDRGLSDFDVRNRVAITAIYDLPFRNNRFVEGWELAATVQTQSGNPINIVTSNSTVNGVANTLRPDVIGPVQLVGNVDRWFDTSVFVPVAGFGNLGRNVVIGPGFSNTDFSIIKNTMLSEKIRVQFRAEFFDLFNHPNFGQPGNVVGGPNFGRIVNTRFPTGESGTSRQVQFALKLLF